MSITINAEKLLYQPKNKKNPQRKLDINSPLIIHSKFCEELKSEIEDIILTEIKNKILFEYLCQKILGLFEYITLLGLPLQIFSFDTILLLNENLNYACGLLFSVNRINLDSSKRISNLKHQNILFGGRYYVF